MNITICTLFEGNYHYGVAALTNSLYNCGFRGNIYAGYRGPLPKWTEKINKITLGEWASAFVLDVAEGLQLIFIPLDTDYHFTNYKPNFMLELLDGPAKDTEAIFFFDPDICVVEKWIFFEEWVSCGVAICEDVNSPLPENHPRRVGWQRYFSKYNIDLKFRASQYVNGGFIGVCRENYSFLNLWKKIQTAMADEIGGLAVSKLVKGATFQSKGFANCFDASDQDALNAAIEASNTKISVIGKEAMGFLPGGIVIPHAIGRPKPWEKKIIISTVFGTPSTYADVAFWNSVHGPIHIYSLYFVAGKRLALSFSRAIQRIYRRN